MANEGDMKRIDLKVSVNCCEGCKRKVLKALSVKGVLKTEIHPTLPRITVIGNIEVQTLIKKLAKIRKTAELLPMAMEAPTAEREEDRSKSSDSHRGSEELKIDEGKNTIEKSTSKPEKGSNSIDNGKSNNPDSTAEDTHTGDSCETTVPLVSKNIYSTAELGTTVPEMNCVVNQRPVMLQNQQACLMVPQQRLYYPMESESYAVPMPNSYSAPPPCYNRHHCYCELLVYHHPPPMQSQGVATGLVDYFNDDNTAGCRVM